MIMRRSQAGPVVYTRLRWDMIASSLQYTEGNMLKAICYLVLSAVFCLTVTGSAFGQNRQMYRWTDEDGVIHFTDTRPEGREVQVYDIPEPEQQAVRSAPVPAEPVDELSPAQQRREEIARRREEAQAAQAVNDAECAAKRAEVEQLEPHRRVFFTNEQGETERMDDVERTNRVAEARAFIEANCN